MTLADRMAGLLVKAGALGLLAMTAIIGWQVFGRYVLQSSPSWSEQAALLLMIWYVFLASAAGVWERFHIRIELLELTFSPTSRRRLRITIHLLIAAMGLVFLVYGTALALDVREHVIPSLGISRAWAYVVIPFAGVLIALFSLGRIRVRLNEAKEPR
ncbi:TRAP transporter small permease [Aurantiacibacter luteus]|uniref:TRAP transporter small permease protein n=1 Tax=Aurantiacibacter luteus TaxID=1581420 RepID=A0A0G9MNV5_9SPHN|nr:TRAP transporter small permease [Aurantiacibacter luteus]KLE32390.1 C4-dicarboxylate ABC transporter substrate-binding protein [Aurantiacibacter luteus]